MTTLHLRHDGSSYDVTLARLGVYPSTSDNEIRAAVAAHFDINPDTIKRLVIEKEPNGNITLRPEAVFG